VDVSYAVDTVKGNGDEILHIHFQIQAGHAAWSNSGSVQRKICSNNWHQCRFFTAKLELKPGDKNAEIESHRLNLVSEYIEKNEKIGTLDKPERWIKDRLEVMHVQVEENPALFLLVGKRQGRYHLLGGSSRHVVGNVCPTTVQVAYSYFPYLADAMNGIFSDDLSASIRVLPQREEERLGFKRSKAFGMNTKELSNVVWTLFHRSKGQSFPVEFLARFFVEGGTTAGYRCTISSPLYVNQV
jgi:hypothetical protein